MLKLGRLYYTSKGFDFSLWEIITNYLHGIILWNNLHPHCFLYSITEKYCTNFKPCFLAESVYLPYDLRFVIAVLGFLSTHNFYRVYGLLIII